MATNNSAISNPTNNMVILYGDATISGNFDKIEVVKGTLRFTGVVRILEIHERAAAFLSEDSDADTLKIHEGGFYQHGTSDSIVGWC